MFSFKVFIFHLCFFLSLSAFARGEGGGCTFKADKINEKADGLRTAIQMRQQHNRAVIQEYLLRGRTNEPDFQEKKQLEDIRGAYCHGRGADSLDWNTSEKIIAECDFEGIKSTCEAARAKAAEAGSFEKKLEEITARSKDGRPSSGPLKDLKSLYESADAYHQELKKAIKACDNLAKGRFGKGSQCLDPYKDLESEDLREHVATYCSDEQIDQLVETVRTNLTSIAQTACDVFNGQVEAKAGEIEIHNTKSAIATTMNQLCDGNPKSCRKVAGE